MQNFVYIELNSVNQRLKIFFFFFFGCQEEELEVKPAGTNSKMNEGYVPEERKSFSYY